MNSSDSSDAAYTRRGFISGSGALAGAVLLAEAQPSPAQQPSTQAAEQRAVAPGATATPPVETLAQVLWDLVAANRILAHFNLIDGYGHVSVRNPNNPNSYLQAATITPSSELMTLDDLGEFDLDNRPMDTKGRRSWPERFIFGGIYKARPDVGAILHCHPPAIVLMSVMEEPLRPIYHMASFIGEGIPVFDLSKVVGRASGLTVTTLEHGRAIAQSLGDKPGVLMRGHGCAVVGKSLSEAVGRVVYLNINCQLQAQVLGRKIQYLSAEEVPLQAGQGDFGVDWELWKTEVMSNSPSLYSTVG